MRFVFVTALLASATVVFAQEPDRTDTVDSRMSVGQALFAAGRYRAAIVEFKAANRIEPAPEIDLAIARCYDRLNEAGPAVTYYPPSCRLRRRRRRPRWRGHVCAP